MVQHMSMTHSVPLKYNDSLSTSQVHWPTKYLLSQVHWLTQYLLSQVQWLTQYLIFKYTDSPSQVNWLTQYSPSQVHWLTQYFSSTLTHSVLLKYTDSLSTSQVHWLTQYLLSQVSTSLFQTAVSPQVCFPAALYTMWILSPGLGAWQRLTLATNICYDILYYYTI